MMLRETGFPYGRMAGLPAENWENAADLSEENPAFAKAAEVFRLCLFAYFEAFDQPFKM